MRYLLILVLLGCGGSSAAVGDRDICASYCDEVGGILVQIRGSSGSSGLTCVCDIYVGDED